MRGLGEEGRGWCVIRGTAQEEEEGEVMFLVICNVGRGKCYYFYFNSFLYYPT
jgi:hypothetical protein